MSVEDSGLSCNYYVVEIKHPWSKREPYLAECGDIMEALDMSMAECNVFKELWRRAAARQGKKKKGNTSLRGAEKIKFFSDLIYAKELQK